MYEFGRLQGGGGGVLGKVLKVVKIEEWKPQDTQQPQFICQIGKKNLFKLV